MSANRSSAVMQQRAPAPDELDYFPTPPWATRALCEFLTDVGELLPRLSCWEPACGERHMARPLSERFHSVIASDVHRYEADYLVADFLIDAPFFPAPDWIITNPPFTLAERFIARARETALRGSAMLVRSAFLEGGERYEQLFKLRPPSIVLQFAERVVMLRGRLIRDGSPDPFNLYPEGDPKAGQPRKASSATSYAWLIWQPGRTDTRHRWIGRVRRSLERPGDYPAYPEQWAKLAARDEAAAMEGAML